MTFIMFFFFFNDTATTEIYTLSLPRRSSDLWRPRDADVWLITSIHTVLPLRGALVAYYEGEQTDRKSTRLNSSHANISYAVFCLKKKKNSRNGHKSVCRNYSIDDKMESAAYS